ncbi:MAG: OsmC family protein [Simkaniaceae bacterium]
MAVFEIQYQGNLCTKCLLPDTNVELITEAPKPEKEKKNYFCPSDLLALSLASCILTIFAKEANRLGLDVIGAKATVHKVMEKDPRRIKKLHVTVYCPKTFDSSVVAEIEKAAQECPVHKAIHPDVEQVLEFQWGEK